MQAARALSRRAGIRLVSRPVLGRAAVTVGAVRGRGLALLWHRIRPRGAQPHEVVRAVAVERFDDQLGVLQELGDVVPLEDLEPPRRGRRPRFALTFDDDDAGHAEHTLPLLVSRDLPATFFLSGRWQRGDGPYWWELLEARVRAEGVAAVAAGFGIVREHDAVGLARALTGTPVADELAEDARRRGDAPMAASHAADLASAGMEIGFHTRHHPSLPTLQDGDLCDAVAAGRDELAAQLGVPVVRFAYPHGHVDDRVAEVVGDSGYRSAWTTAKRVAVQGQDQMRCGRWDLGHLSTDDFRRRILLGLARSAP